MGEASGPPSISAAGKRAQWSYSTLTEAYKRDDEKLHWVDSHEFNLLISGMIVLNAFTLGIQVEVEFDCRRTNTCEEHIVFFIAEQVFTFTWVAEMVVYWPPNV